MADAAGCPGPGEGILASGFGVADAGRRRGLLGMWRGEGMTKEQQLGRTLETGSRRRVSSGCVGAADSARAGDSKRVSEKAEGW